MPSKYSGYGVAGAASVGFMHPIPPVPGGGMVLPSYQLICIIKPHAWEIQAWMRSFQEDLASPSLASPEVVIGKEEVDPEQREGPDAQPSPKSTLTAHWNLPCFLRRAGGRAKLPSTGPRVVDSKLGQWRDWVPHWVCHFLVTGGVLD